MSKFHQLGKARSTGNNLSKEDHGLLFKLNVIRPFCPKEVEVEMADLKRAHLFKKKLKKA